MPEYDLGEIARRLAEGQTISEIGAELDGPPGPTPEEQAAADQRRNLQQARGALNAEAAPPGQEPDEDPIARGFALADQSGHRRGSDGRAEAYIDAVFQAAQAGDPRVVHEGTIDDATRRRWHDDALRRQISNREATTRTRDR
jgi:hypothetical protein